MATAVDARSMYLDLLRNYLTRYGESDFTPIRAGDRPLRKHILNALAKRNLQLMREVPFDKRKRDLGQDWPATAETMIGMQRLSNLQRCVETVIAEDIPGDLVECGVWRGGSCILMRAVLAVYGDEKRCVWVTHLQGYRHLTRKLYRR